MTLEVSCLGEVLECRLQKRVPEEGSGSGFWPPGQSLGPQAETAKGTLRAARALMPGKPLTSHRG